MSLAGSCPTILPQTNIFAGPRSSLRNMVAARRVSPQLLPCAVISRRSPPLLPWTGRTLAITWTLTSFPEVAPVRGRTTPLQRPEARDARHVNSKPTTSRVAPVMSVSTFCRTATAVAGMTHTQGGSLCTCALGQLRAVEERRHMILCHLPSCSCSQPRDLKIIYGSGCLLNARLLNARVPFCARRKTHVDYFTIKNINC